MPVSAASAAPADNAVIREILQPDPALQKRPVQLPAPYRNQAWSQAGGFATNAPYHLLADGTLRLRWVERSRDLAPVPGPAAALIMAAGRVFALDAGERVLAFDAATGKRLWQAASVGVMPPAERDTAALPGGGLAFDDGLLFSASVSGVLRAMRPDTGHIVWERKFGGRGVSALVADGGRIFLTIGNQLLALAQADGRLLWDHHADPGIVTVAGGPAVAGNIVVAPFGNGEIYALHAQTGGLMWKAAVLHDGAAPAPSGELPGRPVIDRDMVFAVGRSGLMVALHLSDGRRAWQRDIGGLQMPWAGGDYVYVLSALDQLICLERRDGRIRWLHQLPSRSNGAIPNWAGPLLISDRLLVVSADGQIDSLSPYTGLLLGGAKLPVAMPLAPIAADGMVYVFGGDETLLAMR